MEPTPGPAPRAVLFDAYGTLFDVYSVGVVAERLFPGAGERLGILWRDKQIEYTRLTSMSGQTRSFRDCTRAGLRYAARRFDLALDAAAERELMGAYERLAPFAENRAVLVELRRRGVRAGILSNGDPDMLEAVVRHAGFAELRRSGPERRGHRPLQDRPGDLRARHAGARPRRRRGPVRLEQLLGRDRRDLVRLHDALDQPLRPAARRARRAPDAHRHPAHRRPRLLRFRKTLAMTTTTLDPSCRRADQRTDPARLRDHPDPAGARARRQAAPRLRAAPPAAARLPRAERAKRLDAGERPDFLPETADDPRRRLEDRAGAAGAAMPARRDHRPGRREDGHQRLQLGRRFVHDRLRGLELAALDQPDPGPDQHRPGDPPHACRSSSRRPPARRPTSSTTRSRRCRCARAAGTSTRST